MRKHLTFELLQSITTQFGRQLKMIQLQDERLVLSFKKYIHVWDVASFKCINSLIQHHYCDWVRSFIQLKDGRLVSNHKTYNPKFGIISHLNVSHKLN